MSDIDPSTGRRTATDRRQHVRLAVDFFTHAKHDHILDPVQRAAARALHGHCITMAKRTGSDGHVCLEQALAEMGLPVEFGKIMITDGACHQDDHGCADCPQPRAGHVYVHDYLEHNRSAAQDAETVEARRRSGAKGAESRWSGRNAPVKERRAPGRPRKHPLPEPPVDVTGQTVLVEVDPTDHPAVLQHPAEALARAKRGRPKKEPRVFEQWIIDAANALADGIARNDPNGVRPNVTDTWLNDLRLAHEIDKREPDKIMKAIEWSQNHRGSSDFSYADIIKSPKNLRKHFAAMHSRAIKEHRSATTPRRSTSATRAEQALSVADTLDRKFGHGKYAQEGIR